MTYSPVQDQDYRQITILPGLKKINDDSQNKRNAISRSHHLCWISASRLTPSDRWDRTAASWRTPGAPPQRTGGLSSRCTRSHWWGKRLKRNGRMTLIHFFCCFHFLLKPLSRDLMTEGSPPDKIAPKKKKPRKKQTHSSQTWAGRHGRPLGSSSDAWGTRHL